MAITKQIGSEAHLCLGLPAQSSNKYAAMPMSSYTNFSGFVLSGQIYNKYFLNKTVFD